MLSTVLATATALSLLYYMLQEVGKLAVGRGNGKACKTLATALAILHEAERGHLEI